MQGVSRKFKDFRTRPNVSKQNLKPGKNLLSLTFGHKTFGTDLKILGGSFFFWDSMSAF